ncbi:MAG: hypothetical protein AABY07_09745, partial [Nanoarchaeota archaeon]
IHQALANLGITSGYSIIYDVDKCNQNTPACQSPGYCQADVIVYGYGTFNDIKMPCKIYTYGTSSNSYF